MAVAVVIQVVRGRIVEWTVVVVVRSRMGVDSVSGDGGGGKKDLHGGGGVGGSCW